MANKQTEEQAALQGDLRRTQDGVLNVEWEAGQTGRTPELDAKHEDREREVKRIERRMAPGKTFADFPPLLTPDEAAELLRLDVTTVKDWARAGRLPGAVKIG